MQFDALFIMHFKAFYEPQLQLTKNYWCPQNANKSQVRYKIVNFSNNTVALLDISLLVAFLTLRQQKLSPFISLLHLLYWFYRLVHGFFSVLLAIQLLLFQRCQYFMLLKAIAKSNGIFYAIATNNCKKEQFDSIIAILNFWSTNDIYADYYFQEQILRFVINRGSLRSKKIFGKVKNFVSKIFWYSAIGQIDFKQYICKRINISRKLQHLNGTHIFF